MTTTFSTDLRAAAFGLLQDYRDSTSGRLNVSAGRPASIQPPHAFFDRIRERFEDTGPFIQRIPRALVIVCHGNWDGTDSAAQRDLFVDGFLEYIRTRFHEAGGNTLLSLREVEDIPFYVPEWIDPRSQRAYYATQLTLEGYAET